MATIAVEDDWVLVDEALLDCVMPSAFSEKPWAGPCAPVPDIKRVPAGRRGTRRSSVWHPDNVAKLVEKLRRYHIAGPAPGTQTEPGAGDVVEQYERDMDALFSVLI